jgi:hypothetical protein
MEMKLNVWLAILKDTACLISNAVKWTTKASK